MLVAHGADLHAPLPLPVALLEELGHDAVCPLAVQLQWLGGVAEVRTVHQVLQDLGRPKFRRALARPPSGLVAPPEAGALNTPILQVGKLRLGKEWLRHRCGTLGASVSSSLVHSRSFTNKAK